MDHGKLCMNQKYSPTSDQGERDIVNCLHYQREYLSKDLKIEHLDFKMFGLVDCSLVYSAEYVITACLKLCRQSQANVCNISPVEELKCNNEDIVTGIRRYENTIQSFTRSSPAAAYEAKVFQCSKTRRCISPEQICDLMNDCGDLEDELECVNHFKCETDEPTRLIRITQVCDGVPDCYDGSDEANVNCSQYSALSNEFHIFGGIHMNTKTTSTLIAVCGISGTLISVLALVLHSYQFAADPFKYRHKTICMIFVKFMCTLDCILSGYLIFLGWKNPHHQNPDTHFTFLKSSWLKSQICQKMGIATTASILSILTLSSLTSIVHAKQSCTKVTLLRNRKTTPNCTKITTISLVIFGFLMFLIFVFAYIPCLNISHDTFINTVEYDIFPIQSATKDRVRRLIADYYEDTRNPRTWLDINKAIEDMFSSLHQVIEVKYGKFYGDNEICALPLLIRDSDTNAARVYKQLTLIYLGIILITTFIFTAFNMIYNLTRPLFCKPKTDFPGAMVTIITSRTVVCFTPLMTLAILHNITTYSMDYHYTLLMLVTIATYVNSNIMIVTYILYVVLRQVILTTAKYPSAENIGYEPTAVKEHDGFLVINEDTVS